MCHTVHDRSQQCACGDVFLMCDTVHDRSQQCACGDVFLMCHTVHGRSQQCACGDVFLPNWIRDVCMFRSQHLDLSPAPYVLYGVEYIGLVTLAITLLPKHPRCWDRNMHTSLIHLLLASHFEKKKGAMNLKKKGAMNLILEYR